MYSGGAVLELNHDVVELTWKRKLILELLVTINGKTNNIRKRYFCSQCLIELLDNVSYTQSTFHHSILGKKNVNARRNLRLMNHKSLIKSIGCNGI